MEGQKIRRYLLGSLIENEVEEIELRLISDPSFEEELYLAENNLMEDYLENSLSPPEVKLFQENFLSCKERQSELENLALLRNYAQKKRLQEFSDEKIKGSSGFFFRKLSDFFARNLHPIAAVLAVAMLLGMIGFYFFNSGKNEIARLNQVDLSNVAEYQNLTNLNLNSISLRDAVGSNKLSANNLTDPVLLRLDLPVEGNAFDVSVKQGEREIARLDRISPYRNQSGRELRLLLPASLLMKGEYRIEAAPENSNESSVVFTFAVQ